MPILLLCVKMYDRKDPRSMKGSYLSLFPEAAGDILPRIIMSILVEPLVSGGAVEGTEVLKVRTNLDIIKIVFIKYI